MSHVVDIDAITNDLDCLDAVLNKHFPQLRLQRGQETYKWYGDWVNDYHGDDAAFRHGIDTSDYGKCTHAIVWKDGREGYEIGLCRDKSGDLRLIMDNFSGGRGLEEAVGKNAHVLAKRYGLEVASKQARAAGMTVTEIENEQTGEITLDFEQQVY